MTHAVPLWARGLAPDEVAPQAPVYLPTTPPWELPPPGAINFLSENAGGSSIGPGPTTLRIASLVTPGHMVGVIREVQFEINNILATTVIRFELQFNGVTVPGFSRTMFPKAAATDVFAFDPRTTMVEIPGNEPEVSVLVRLTDGGTYLVGVMFRGWFYDERIRHAYRQRAIAG